MRNINSDAYKPAVIDYLQCSIKLPESGGLLGEFVVGGQSDLWWCSL